MSNSNKVKFGLKNCHYAKATFDEDGNVTYEKPIRMPGAVSLSMDPEGENENFYADDIVYYVINNNSGYSGDLELALIPESFLKDILHEEEDANGVMAENATVSYERFALLFEFSGDAKAIAAAPGIGVKTAQRVILDLKDRMDFLEAFEGRLASHGGGEDKSALVGVKNEAVMALTALGYTSSDVLSAMAQMDIPEDISVAGCDDQSFAKYLSPGLTTIRLPLISRGKRAIHCLSDYLRGKQSGLPREYLLPELVIRSSVAAPPDA